MQATIEHAGKLEIDSLSDRQLVKVGKLRAQWVGLTTLARQLELAVVVECSCYSQGQGKSGYD